MLLQCLKQEQLYFYYQSSNEEQNKHLRDDEMEGEKNTGPCRCHWGAEEISQEALPSVILMQQPNAPQNWMELSANCKWKHPNR